MATNVRLIKTAVYRRDPMAKNKPLQNAMNALMKGLKDNDVEETEAALTYMRKQVDLHV